MACWVCRYAHIPPPTHRHCIPFPKGLAAPNIPEAAVRFETISDLKDDLKEILFSIIFSFSKYYIENIKLHHYCNIFVWSFYIMCTTDIYKLYYCILSFSLSKHEANTTELHPKVRPTCFSFMLF